MGKCHFFRKTVLLTLIAVLSAPSVNLLAENSSPDILPGRNEKLVLNAVGLGAYNVLDEYMSNNVYRGPELNLAFQRERLLRNSEEWFIVPYLEAGFSPMNNRNGNGSMLSLMLDWHLSWERLWISHRNFTLTAGPAFFAKVGGLYNSRNSNNPAQLKLYAGAALSGEAVYRVNIRNFPLSLSWRADLPLIGYNFAPTYGLLYYEIGYLGKFGEASHFAWPGNLFALSQRISVDIPVRKAKLRLSYLGDYYRYDMGGIRCRMYGNSFMVGVVKKFEIKYNGR